MTNKFARHPRTGLIGEFSDATIRRFGLIEVGRDAKPLAYTPIPEAKIALAKDKKEEK